ncbi:hypothetical protein [Blastococcus saxobsidens]|uniref:hypothetical protein n=1 Tax=Blastococcus saxobsidens TaxID=138336 RepID=UPI000CEC37BD|nr:hypothetical protein [Blastococcus saxobsidens]
MTSIYLGPGAELRLAFDEIAAEAGFGGHRLALRYKATPVGLPPGSVAFISGALRLQSTMSWVGVLHAAQQLPISGTAAYPRSVLLTTTISDAQLAGIETARQGSDLELLVDLNVTLANAPPLDYPAGDAQDWVRVPGPIWAVHAERLGALVSVPLLVPLPLGDPDSLRARAGRRLQSAMRAQTDGRAEDAVRDARLALDLYDQLDPTSTYDPQGAPRQRDLDQRFAALRTTLFSLASGAHHDDTVTANFRYTRQDATAIIACVAALLQRR